MPSGSPAGVAPTACPTCDTPRAGAFCAGCGQRFRDGRLTVWGVGQQVVGELVAVDRGLLHTAWAATVAPGRLAADHVAGRTSRHVGPVKYYLLVVGAMQLLALKIGFLQDMMTGLLDGADGTIAASADEQTRTFGLVRDYFVSLTAVAVPIYAGWTRLLCRRAGLNYAEHLVLALYTGAQLIAGLVLWAALTWGVARAVAPVPYFDGLYYLLAPIYQTAALAGFTGLRWPSAAWRMLLAGLLAALCWVVVMSVGAVVLEGPRRG